MPLKKKKFYREFLPEYYKTVFQFSAVNNQVKGKLLLIKLAPL